METGESPQETGQNLEKSFNAPSLHALHHTTPSSLLPFCQEGNLLPRTSCTRSLAQTHYASPQSVAEVTH